jgi:hypothetical protein
MGPRTGPVCCGFCCWEHLERDNLSLVPSMIYTPGQLVNRIEDREQVAAVVLTVHDTVLGEILELGYTEGGSGWWPAESVEVPNE